MAKGGGGFPFSRGGTPKGKFPPDLNAKIKTNINEMKAGRLHSGSKSGPKVTNPKQAMAISFNQARKGRK